MIFDEIVLHNFGVYGGRHEITLTPTSAEQPIVLFGGLNGGGKTTFLDALQLCLYGPLATTSNRNGAGYEDYLRRCIHRGAEVPEAAIELAFRHTSNGREHSFRLHRSWRATRDGGCTATFEVYRDGALDRLATDGWVEQVEEFIPARIASLFLFDGEKIESYADLQGAPALIGSAIQNLLGLDIVERLGADLSVLERRKRSEGKSGKAAQSGADSLRDRIEALQAERTRLHAETSQAANALDQARRTFEQLDARYKREGGDLYERRAALESAAASALRDVATSERELRDLAAGAAPLLLVAHLLAAADKQVRFEQEVVAAREMSRALESEHNALLELPPLRKLAAADRQALAHALTDRRSAYAALGAHATVLELSSEGQALLASLRSSDIPDLHQKLKRLIGKARTVKQARDDAQAALAAAPNEDRLADLAQARSKARESLVVLEAERKQRESELGALDRELAQLREREARAAEAEARMRFENEDTARLLEHSARVRGTLARFRDAIVARHVSRIERLVLESFQLLIRKPELVTALSIDPVTFNLQLVGSDRRQLSPERLSAGERQLLAVAILWGLAKASGRPLPTVIDTPLGRLDSHHRARLVERYFPNASHQVVLLSTDEEIAGDYYEALKPFIGRTYRLSFDAAAGRTDVEDGYLEPKALRHVA